MRIAVSSTQCNGKSTFIKSFLERWDMYKTPSPTYRELIKEKSLKLNTLGDLESQKIIRDSLIDQAIKNSSEEFCIHDRCILDNLAYTLWLAEKGNIKDENFIADSINLTRETIKLYDIVLFLPLSDKSPIVLEESYGRSLDLEFREEINNIFLGIEASYKEFDGIVFPTEDSPALIRVEGDEENKEKTDYVSNYLNDDGTFKTTDESLMKSFSELAQEDALVHDLLHQVKL